MLPLEDYIEIDEFLRNAPEEIITMLRACDIYFEKWNPNERALFIRTLQYWYPQ